MATRTPKKAHLLDEIRGHLDAGTVRYTSHAFERGDGREITEPEVRYVLRNGWHNRRRDRYEEGYVYPWSHSIEGRTVDERRLRIVVTFDDSDGEVLLVVTLIDLDRAG